MRSSAGADSLVPASPDGLALTVVTEHYPADFKSYFDTQFVDLLERGHDLTILAGGKFEDALSHKVLRWGLDGRTRYYPVTLRSSHRALGPFFRALGRRQWHALPHRRRFKETFLCRARLVMARERQPDLVLIHGLTAGDLFHGVRQALPGIPIGLYYHGGELPGMPAHDRAAASSVFAEATHVFTNTRFSADHAVARGCPPDKITILPVGFDLRSYPDPGPRPRGRPLRLLTAGRMSPEKGQIHALEALRILRDRGTDDVHYTLTGSANAYRQRLEEYVARHGLADRVEFVGTVTTEVLIGLMRRSDVLLLPSLHLGNWAENQAAAVQEAMLLRSVVITSDTGGVPDSIPPEMQPFKVPPARPEALARAILRARDLSHEAWAATTAAGRRFVEERYDIRRLNQTMLDVLTS